MSEQVKADTSCGEYSRGAPWYPLRKWWHLSQLFSQDAGLPSFLESGDARWMDVDWLQRSLAACSWPGYIPALLFVPYISGSMHHPSQTISKWRVIMDVAHFTPSEISLSIRDGFLEVRGIEHWLTSLLIKQLEEFTLLTLLITFTHRIVSGLNEVLKILSSYQILSQRVI